ncbi:competence protein CoiA family protein [Vibrio ulleungensis]|uniref:Uncharacterized protein n=1 Tax=Vibrio ulleungensis TaxID=2807619 RepID=A0ABS2HMR4_9VIBR|nr:hypothetical protein [Vibrio ulleungensis]MBM7037427.1 hypothetical protein [Vibrio ulleungensis]
MLIPFAIHEKTGKYVDISEVERGRNCGCICPSCKQRLVARFCNGERIDHFAHDASNNQADEKKKECDYSFFVAAKLMIKQSLVDMESLAIKTPEWTKTLTDEDRFGNQVTTTKRITGEKQLDTTSFTVHESTSSNQPFDVSFEIGGYPIGVRLQYTNRDNLELRVSSKHSALVIDLDDLAMEYDQFSGTSLKTFKEVAIEYFLQSGTRYWKCHAREASLLPEMLADLEVKKQASEKEREAILVTRRHILEQTVSHYKSCGSCQTVVYDAVGLVCRKCGTFYTDVPLSEVFDVEDDSKFCMRCQAKVGVKYDNNLCSDCVAKYINEGVWRDKDFAREIRKLDNIKR